MKELKYSWKMPCAVIILGALYSLWLWRDAAMSKLLVANVLSVIAMLFLIVAIAGVLHNVHAMAAFSYSFRYLSHLFRNLRDRDMLTNEKMISYADYIKGYTKWKTVPVSILFFFIFMVLSMAVWFIF